MIRVERPILGKPVGEGVYYSNGGWQLIKRWREKDGLDLDSEYVTSDPSFHPSPDKDSKLGPIWAFLSSNYYEIYYYFGFVDMSQFRQWFYNDEILKELMRIGYKVVEYETGERYHEGYTQAICHKDDMKLKRIIDPFKH